MVLSVQCELISSERTRGRRGRSLGGERLPLGQGGRASGFEVISADEVAILVEVVVEGGVDRIEFLQGLHLAEPLHGPFSSPKRQVGVLDAVVQPAARFLFPGAADLLQSRPVGSQSIGDDRLGWTVATHGFLPEFQRGSLVPCPGYKGF